MNSTAPAVIDLFAGVGGLSLGAARAGFNVKASVELDARALKYHALNFPNAIHLGRDVGALTGEDLLREAGIEKGQLAGLVGGPPCQGFSDMGRRVADDPRNSLLGAFFRLVAETNPAFFVAENVPGLLAERNAEKLREAIGLIPKSYTVLEPMIVKASDYGAPTTRTRVFFIGYRDDACSPLTHLSFKAKLAEDIRVGFALSNLPRLFSHWATEAESWRSVGSAGETEFEKRLSDTVPFGVGDATALQRYKSKRLVSGFLGTVHTPETVKRFQALAPGAIDSVSRAKRLQRDGFCPTLRAGTGPEKGSYQAVRPIHPSSPRVISPREAARLQGFPDWFQFHPTKWHGFRQIGNSVSPLVAEHVLSVIKTAISSYSTTLEYQG
jgi:DNA (cytosine-5)-methyltransferase 1